MSRARHIGPFLRDEDGGALVEFALLLPSLLLFLALSIEGGRTFWSYQTTITGVRDAARYLSRAADVDICTDGGTTSGWNAKLAQIVRETQSGESLFPPSVSVTGVTSALACGATDFRGGTAPVATVTASLTIGYPFAGLFGFVGIDVRSISTTVTDSARVLGI